MEMIELDTITVKVSSFFYLKMDTYDSLWSSHEASSNCVPFPVSISCSFQNEKQPYVTTSNIESLH